MPVKPESVFGGFFAGWAGHIKFRAMMAKSITEAQIKVLFTPTYGILPWSAGQVLTDQPSNDVALPGGTGTAPTYQRSDFNSSYAPIEYAYPIGTNQSFVDISVPFDTIYNFHPVNTSTIPETIPDYVGWICLNLNGSGGYQSSSQTNSVFTAVGDDFSYVVYRPPPQSAYQPFVYDGTEPYPVIAPANYEGFIV
jgi:hypothetical protein